MVLIEAKVNDDNGDHCMLFGQWPYNLIDITQICTQCV